jgi:hypothetical protein
MVLSNSRIYNALLSVQVYRDSDMRREIRITVDFRSQYVEYSTVGKYTLSTLLSHFFTIIWNMES